MFVVTETTDNCANKISEVDDELVVDLATDTQGNNVSTHGISDYMDNEDAHVTDRPGSSEYTRQTEDSLIHFIG